MSHDQPPPPPPGGQPPYGPPGDQPPGPPGWGNQPPYGGGDAGYQPGYGGAPQDHPKAQTAMILGILGLVCCSPLAIPAFIIGNRAVQEIDAAGGRIGGRGMANAGKIMGIIGMVLLVLSVIWIVFVLVLGAGMTV